MYRLFMQSALGKRTKCRTMRGTVNYVQYTLQRCLSRQKVFWQPSVEAVQIENARWTSSFRNDAARSGSSQAVSSYAGVRNCAGARFELRNRP